MGYLLELNQSFINPKILILDPRNTSLSHTLENVDKFDLKTGFNRLIKPKKIDGVDVDKICLEYADNKAECLGLDKFFPNIK